MKKSLVYGMGLLLCLMSGLFTGCKDKIELPGELRGVVTDKATGEPIKTAGVELQPVGLKTVTGLYGQYGFNEIEPGKYKLYITKTGYVDWLSNEIVVTSEQIAQGNVQLEKLPPALRIVNDKQEDIDELDFGAGEDDVMRSFNIFNDGSESLQWSITNTADWIVAISKARGTLEAEAMQAVDLTIDRNKLKGGDNVTTMLITSNDGSKQLKVKAVGESYVTIPELGLMVLKYDMPEYTWHDAKSACEQLTEGGYTDWRLPTTQELGELCDRKSEVGVFMQDIYWSVSPRVGYDGFHQLVNFEPDADCYRGFSVDYYVYRARAVRTITE